MTCENMLMKPKSVLSLSTTRERVELRDNFLMFKDMSTERKEGREKLTLYSEF